MIFSKSKFNDYQKIREIEVSNNLNIPRKKNFEYYVKYLFFKLLSTNTKLSKRLYSINDKELIDLLDIENVLILRYDVIGDYIVSTSLIRYIKSINPKINIDIVVTDKNKIIAENDPNIRNVFVVPYIKNVNLKYLELKKLRKNNYDICFSLVISNNTKAAITTKLAAPNSIKITMYNTGNHKIYGQFFNRMTKYLNPRVTWTQKMLNLGKLAISNECDDLNNHNPYIVLNENSVKIVNEFIKVNKLSYKPKVSNIFSINNVHFNLLEQKGREYIIFNITGSKSNKTLNDENIKLITTELALKYPDLIIFLTGGPIFVDKIKKIVKEINLENVKEINLDLLSFMGVLIGARLLISPDTSAIHIAATAGVEMVVLFANIGFVYEWFPYQTKFIPLLSEPSQNINDIDYNDVVFSANILLNNEINDNIIYNINDF